MAKRKQRADKRGPRERVYDAQISPLMARIIAVCEREGIPLVAKFELDADGGDDGGPLFCTTAIELVGAHACMTHLARVALPAPALALAFAITQRPGLTTIRRVT